jgi:hypothetical protein
VASVYPTEVSGSVLSTVFRKRSLARLRTGSTLESFPREIVFIADAGAASDVVESVRFHPKLRNVLDLDG